MATITGTPYFEVINFETAQQITNVQNVILTKGRRNITDLYSAGTATVTGRRPDLLPTLRIGDRITLKLKAQTTSGTSEVVFSYRVADLIIEYGIMSSLDTWSLELEDAFAYLGRAALPTLVINNSTNTALAADAIADAIGINQGIVGTTQTITSAQTVTNQNALDVYQTLINTEQAFVSAGADYINWYARDYWIANSTLTNFSDDSTPGSLKYSTYNGASLADNYADKVIVRPRGTSDVVTGTGIFAYNLDSFSFDMQQATFLGQFILGSLDVDFETPRSIGVIVNGQDDSVFDPIDLLTNPQAVSVKFRGLSTSSQVIGFQVYSRPEETRYELFLTSREFYRFLILDDLVLGQLDLNKLGW